MLFLFFSFFFTKFDQMSRVGSRARHPKCRAKMYIKALLAIEESCSSNRKIHFMGG